VTIENGIISTELKESKKMPSFFFFSVGGRISENPKIDIEN
jgi:hypothetical protein